MKLILSVLATLLISIQAAVACPMHQDEVVTKIEREIARIEQESNSVLGISAINLKTGQSFHYNADQRFKMASTVKLPIATYLLSLVDKGHISLNKKIDINEWDLVLGSGKLGYFLTKPGLSVSLYNLMEPMITISDNTATDLIIKQVGGMPKIQQFIKAHGINDMFASSTIREIFIQSDGITNIPNTKTMNLKKWSDLTNQVPAEQKKAAWLRFFNDSQDTTTPAAMTSFLAKLMTNKIISAHSLDLLKATMTRTENKRIRALIPTAVTSGNKSGTFYDSTKQYAISNDVGFIELPDDAGTIVISVYTSSSHGASVEAQVKAISLASKTIYDYFYFKETEADTHHSH